MILALQSAHAASTYPASSQHVNHHYYLRDEGGGEGRGGTRDEGRGMDPEIQIIQYTARSTYIHSTLKEGRYRKIDSTMTPPTICPPPLRFFLFLHKQSSLPRQSHLKNHQNNHTSKCSCVFLISSSIPPSSLFHL